MSENIRGKIALVTGAGSGIGEATAIALAKEGAYLVLAGRRESYLQKVASEIKAHGSDVLFQSTDVSNRDEVQSLVNNALDKFGRIDILVNNAGINTKRRGVGDIDLEDWDKVISVNLTGVFNCVRAVLPQMRERKDGLIVNISSLSGKRASKLGGAAYCASKHGVVALTYSINDEERENRIRSCVICPGEVATPILDYRPNPVTEEHRSNMLLPEDIAQAVVFVASLPPRAIVTELLIKPVVQS